MSLRKRLVKRARSSGSTRTTKKQRHADQHPTIFSLVGASGFLGCKDILCLKAANSDCLRMFSLPQSWPTKIYVHLTSDGQVIRFTSLTFPYSLDYKLHVRLSGGTSNAAFLRIMRLERLWGLDLQYAPCITDNGLHRVSSHEGLSQLWLHGRNSFLYGSSLSSEKVIKFISCFPNLQQVYLSNIPGLTGRFLQRLHRSLPAGAQLYALPF